MDGRDEINVYCEEYANKLVSQESKVWIMSSKAYTKRWNLNQDPACWQGWEVHMRTSRKDIQVIMLRRKYIPPLLDTFVDFVVVAEGSDKSGTSLAKIPPDAKDFKETENILAMGRKVADSFHANFVTSTLYETLIQKRADSLYYDEETLNFLYFRLPNKIKPKFVLYGVAYLSYILKVISKFHKNALHIKQLLYNKYKDEPWDESWDPFNPDDTIDANAIVTALEKKLVHYGKKNKEEGGINWKFKIARYFAYCVDGGLLSFYFNLSSLIEAYMSFPDKEKDTLNKIIQFLLHFKPEKEPYNDTASLATKIYDMLHPSERFVYNQRVMVTLLATDYFKKELAFSDKNIYSKFLMHMLEKTDNPFVKTAICTQIIQDQEEKKAASSSVDVNFSEVKTIIKPLLYLYQGDNIKLATLAAIALSNLCAKSREVKQFVMAEGGDIILARLEARDEDLLLYSLQLLEYLMTVSQNISLFVAKDAISKVIKILEGSGIVGVWYSDKVLTIVVQILRVIISNMEEYKKLLNDHIDLIVGIFNCKKPGYKISDQLAIEIMNLYLLKLMDKDNLGIQTIGQKLLPHILQLFKEDLFKTKDSIDKVLTFFYGFKNSEEMIKLMKEAGIDAKLKELSGDHPKKAPALRQELLRDVSNNT